MASERAIRSGCAYCNSGYNLALCKGGCMVVMYCSQEHQQADQKEHKPICQEIHEKRLDHMVVKNKILEGPGVPHVGHLWIGGTYYRPGILRTWEYYKTQSKFKKAIAKVRTKQAIEYALDLYKDWHPQGTVDILPGLSDRAAPFLVRLNRDDECPSHYINGLAEMDIDREGRTYMPMNTSVERFSADRLIQIILRARVAVDLRSLQMAAKAVGPKLPTEILDQIRREVVSSPFVQKNRKILEGNNHDLAISELKKDIREMALSVHRENRHLWPRMLPNLDCAKPLPDPPKKMTNTLFRLVSLDRVGTDKDEDVNNIAQAWIESPGALEYIWDILLRALPRTTCLG